MKKKYDITIVEKYTSRFIVDANSEEEAMDFINDGMADPCEEKWETLYHDVKEETK